MDSTLEPRLVKWLDEIRASYWFLPTVMALGAVTLFVVTTRIDSATDLAWLLEEWWLGAHRPEGVRTLLATIASSMIGVAGVTFSITIASVSFASAQYGPRILTNFMRDRGNQVTLGTFIATFLFCLLALRTVRSPFEDGDAAFVPSLTILVALALCIASLAVLIYFIHHVPDSIQISNVVARIGRELDRKLAKIGGTDDTGAPPQPDLVPAAGGERLLVAVHGEGTGYLQQIARDRLVDLAQERELTIHLHVRPGDFLWPGQRIASVATSDLHALSPGEEPGPLEAIRGTLVHGSQRTTTQDVLFLLDQLLEIATRALSPGINDPFTACSCLDWLGAALGRLGAALDPDPHLRDDTGRVRVIERNLAFEEILSHGFEQLRPHVAGDLRATLHALRTLIEIHRTLASDRAVRQGHVMRHIEALLRTARERLPSSEDRQRLEAAWGELRLPLSEGRALDLSRPLPRP